MLSVVETSLSLYAFAFAFFLVLCKGFKNPHFAVVMIKNHLFMQNQTPFPSPVIGRKGATPLRSFGHDF